MNQEPFWRQLWEEDIREPLRDIIRQGFFFACTITLEWLKAALKHSGAEEWLVEIISRVFDGLTIVALAALAIIITLNVAFGATRFVIKSFRQ